MAAPVVVAGAQLACTMGAAPSALVVLPAARVLGCSRPAAAVTDSVPLLNVMPFGMCRSPANPMVAAATAAALGVLTPMPCVPVIPAPWTPGSPTVLVGGKPVVTATSQCLCAWAGQITVVSPGQTSVLA
ncbi:MAG TPA: DUF4280 domain-containing protein [Frankiaceae bacterium]|nr:DUF4280 domain-containing protein [Frankiaceae bacterium]